MALLDDLKDKGNFVRSGGASCYLCSLLAKLPKTEKEALQAIMDDVEISHMSISKVLRKNGHGISDGVVGRHRRGGCVGLRK